MINLDVAVMKTNKYASSKSGDTVEVVERAKGGLSIIMADGQGSGKSAKITSSLVVSKAMNLLSDGARDGAVARAVHDYLYMIKSGKVSATLVIISIDLETETLLISRNGHTPVFIKTETEKILLDKKTEPIGVHRFMKPEINEFPITEGMSIVGFTDGFIDAGFRNGTKMNLKEVWNVMDKPIMANGKAELLFNSALQLDDYRPTDDLSVLVASVEKKDSKNPVASFNISVPLKP
ncbi:serine phosphatase RsbU (regulator of sigma subunit) [Desulfitispora alkaliphila]|uniref:PP2C family protein-serine/threonine phosphatase n=1 Tax=Desulfitispora alkaliphila TaxID=622674 RepID=UPI003D22C8F1